ncbi:hypothetical protein OpiT1DRAFT_05838 [Opitutaceae bacterium TAV1]|nr:hypothetical protein OpiT1DRAFT_05838 [Opitutaceae bacterium TAV1]
MSRAQHAFRTTTIPGIAGLHQACHKNLKKFADARIAFRDVFTPWNHLVARKEHKGLLILLFALFAIFV